MYFTKAGKKVPKLFVFNTRRGLARFDTVFRRVLHCESRILLGSPGASGNCEPSKLLNSSSHFYCPIAGRRSSDAVLRELVRLTTPHTRRVDVSRRGVD